MKKIVLKFGGAALGELVQFQKVADIIEQKRSLYDQVVVVVSAMGKMTDELISLAYQISKNPPKREQDMLISVGERISMTLLAMVLEERGHHAISFTGSQAGIITCGRHTDARVIDVKPRRMIPYLNEGRIVIVAGFQGVSEFGEVTTLGRGGSDTTAVALAVALGAPRVEFYKDVKGVFTEDPKKSLDAKYLSKLNYAEAIEIIEKGERKLLHPRAIILAERNEVILFVGSFQEEGEGSLIENEKKQEIVKPMYEVSECLV